MQRALARGCGRGRSARGVAAASASFEDPGGGGGCHGALFSFQAQITVMLQEANCILPYHSHPPSQISMLPSARRRRNISKIPGIKVNIEFRGERGWQGEWKH